jgi:Zn finger protein HypA/HybF involved in hydrogenase expression
MTDCPKCGKAELEEGDEEHTAYCPECGASFEEVLDDEDVDE